MPKMAGRCPEVQIQEPLLIVSPEVSLKIVNIRATGKTLPRMLSLAGGQPRIYFLFFCRLLSMNLTIMSMTSGHNFIHMLNLPLHEKPLMHQDFVPSIPVPQYPAQCFSSIMLVLLLFSVIEPKGHFTSDPIFSLQMEKLRPGV